MTNQSVLVALACAILLAPTSARAQDGAEPAKSPTAVEVTPFVFLGSGTGVGAAVRWPLPAHFSVELETSYRRAEIAGLSTNLSLLFDLPRMGPVTPYVAGGVGLDQYGTPEVLIDGRVVARKRTAFSVNAGGGVRVQAGENWGMRTDARWSKDIGRFGPERFRLYNGVTFGRTER